MKSEAKSLLDDIFWKMLVPALIFLGFVALFAANEDGLPETAIQGQGGQTVSVAQVQDVSEPTVVPTESVTVVEVPQVTPTPYPVPEILTTTAGTWGAGFLVMLVLLKIADNFMFEGQLFPALGTVVGWLFRGIWFIVYNAFSGGYIVLRELGNALNTLGKLLFPKKKDE